MLKYIKSLHLLEKKFVDRVEIERFIYYSEKYLKENSSTNYTSLIFEYLSSLINSSNSFLVKAICYKLLSHSTFYSDIIKIEEDLLEFELTDFVIDYINAKNIKCYDVLIYEKIILGKNYFSRQIFDFFKLRNKFAVKFLTIRKLKVLLAQLEIIPFQESLNFDLNYFLEYLSSSNKLIAVKVWESLKTFEEKNSINLNLSSLSGLTLNNRKVEDSNKFLFIKEIPNNDGDCDDGDCDDVEIDFDYLFTDSYKGDCCNFGCPEF